MRTNKALLLIASVVLTAGSVVADTLAVPATSAAPQADRPSRGMTMASVEARYGAPSERAPAVGQPPITRWTYPEYVVYFENDHVIHTVTK